MGRTKVTKGKHFTKSEDKIIMDNHDLSSKEISKMLDGRTSLQVERRYRYLTRGRDLSDSSASKVDINDGKKSRTVMHIRGKFKVHPDTKIIDVEDGIAEVIFE